MIKLMLTTSVCALLAGAAFLGLAAASASASGVKLSGRDSIFGPPPGPPGVRDLTWPGGETLGISIPAEVHYQQGPAASVRVTGPQGVIDRIVVVDGTLQFDRRMMKTGGDIDVMITAPDVRRFKLSGSQELTITGYNHPDLSVEISGSGEVKAAGTAERVSLRIAGSGEGDLTGLATRHAEVRISGSGDVEAAPTETADVQISGSGDVTIKSMTAKVTSRISGSGDVRQEPR